MATEVYSTETIRLQDENEVELRPLPIAKLRKFMRMWSDHINDIGKKISNNAKLAAEAEEGSEPEMFTEADMTDAQYDILIKMCALSLEPQLKDERTDRQFISYLEDVLDEKTIHRILFVTGGLALGDEAPNQQNPAAEAAGTN